MEDLSLEALIVEAEKKAKEHYQLHPEERGGTIVETKDE